MVDWLDTDLEPHLRSSGCYARGVINLSDAIVFRCFIIRVQ